MTQDEIEIRNIVQSMEDAWNSGDGNAFAAPFVEDADFTVWNGLYAHGQAEIAQGHVQLFNTQFKNVKNRFEVEKVRFLRDDVAVAFVRAGTLSDDDMRWPKVKPLFVLMKQNGQWKINVFQNTPIMDFVEERIRAQ